MGREVIMINIPLPLAVGACVVFWVLGKYPQRAAKYTKGAKDAVIRFIKRVAGK